MSNKNTQNIALSLKKILDVAKNQGVSINELSEEINKKPNSVYTIIRKNNTDWNTLCEIASALKVSPLEFIDGIEDNSGDKARIEELETALADSMELVQVMKMSLKQGVERVEELKERIKKLEKK